MRTLVVIPVHDEHESVATVLRETLAQGLDVLVVDDGSSDGTEAILARTPGITVLRHPTNEGYGQSLIDAFAYAVENDYDVVITLDADWQHEPSHIPRFISELESADIVSGSRYLRDLDRDSTPPPERMRINQVITEELWRRFGLRLTDAFCGFKAYRTAALARMNLAEPGYAMPVELWVQAANLGLRIREIPVRRIYHSDTQRRFGGQLDEPDVRLRYYRQVLGRAVSAVALQETAVNVDVLPEELCGSRQMKHPNRLCHFQRE